MNQFLKNIFNLEQCLTNHDDAHLLECFKQVLNTSSKPKINLTDHPSITIYTPSESKNLQSTKSILIIIHELSRTGAPVVAVDMAKILVKNGFFVTFLTIRRGPLLKELLENGIPVIFDRKLELSYDLHSITNLEIPLELDDFFNSFNCTVAVTAIYYNLAVRYSKFKKPFIWWLHEGSSAYDFLSKDMPTTLSSNIHVYAGGQYVIDQLNQYGLIYHPKILNYGVEDVAIHTNDQNSKNENSKLVKFILPASINRRKGQSILLEAIRLLPSSYKRQAQFIFVGDINSKTDEEGIKIKSNILLASQKNHNIIYIPSIPREELYSLYLNSDILILASLDDPMPVVATEALMFGKIVLCSDHTGTSYYLKDGENGFIFETNNPKNLQKKIQYIIDNKTKLQEIGKKGRHVYEKNFKMEIFEKNLLDIMKEVA